MWVPCVPLCSPKCKPSRDLTGLCCPVLNFPARVKETCILYTLPSLEFSESNRRGTVRPTSTKAVLGALCCQHAWIWNNLGDTSRDVSVILFPEKFINEQGNQVSRGACLSVCPDLRCKVTSSLTVLPFQNGLYHCHPRTKQTLPFSGICVSAVRKVISTNAVTVCIFSTLCAFSLSLHRDRERHLTFVRKETQQCGWRCLSSWWWLPSSWWGSFMA